MMRRFLASGEVRRLASALRNRDGMLLPGVTEALQKLAAQLKIHVVTADTLRMARSQLEKSPAS